MVVFVNKLTVTGEADEVERLYSEIADFMLTQPGIIRFTLVRSRKDSLIYFNVAEWESAEDFERALQQDGFRSRYATLKPMIKGDAHVSDVRLAGIA